MKIAVVGAGLAGSACAYVLAQSGADVSVYERASAPAAGASGNLYGLYNPRFFASYDAPAQFYAQAFIGARAVFEEFAAAMSYRPCGALHLINTAQKEKRFGKMLRRWPAEAVRMERLSSVDASRVAGIDVRHDALYLPDSGAICPRDLCCEYLRRSGAAVHYGAAIDDEMLQDLRGSYGAVIVANGFEAARLGALLALPIKPIRGQVSYIAPRDEDESATDSAAVRCVICYGGYMTPAWDGRHIVGSTFDRGAEHSDVLARDHDDIIAKWRSAIPALNSACDVVGGRASVRSSAPDHMPIIGRVDDALYISAAHGSHGILSSYMGARILAATLCGADLPFDETALESLSPERFL